MVPIPSQRYARTFGINRPGVIRKGDTEGWDPYVSEEMLPSVSLKILTA